jgi:1-deoxy-D-xylulose-5-phosphate reductoisomerase
MKRVAILGSTGSIGRSALAVVDAHPNELQVIGLAAGENAELLAQQIERYQPRLVALSSGQAIDRLRQSGVSAEIAGAGRAGLVAVAAHPDVDIVLCASAGTDALEAVLEAIERRKTIALANKEVLVMAGGLVMDAARRHGVSILPVDSEHNAIHQCLHARRPSEVRRLVLTASGGPFLNRSASELEHVTAADALKHPTWQMGRKITIDSATLMNKGLEVIEAHWLFDTPRERLEVLVHPQSVVHSLVELTDGSMIAQLGVTDMRLPIQYAFSYPDRWSASLPRLDLARVGRLEFAAPDLQSFPCLGLAYRALEAERSLPVVLNAANEVAVGLFLENKIRFRAIAELIEQALDAHVSSEVTTIAKVRGVDEWARAYTADLARGVKSV